MCSPSQIRLLLLLLFFSSSTHLFSTSNAALNPPLHPDTQHDIVCKSTPFPESCLESSKLSISINISPTILGFALRSLDGALSEAGKLWGLLPVDPALVEHQKGAVQDCRELHQITVSSLTKSDNLLRSSKQTRLSDVKSYLSAALTNKNTCMEGLDSASGPSKPILVGAILSLYKHVTNALSIVSSGGNQQGRRLGAASAATSGFPAWLSRRDRRLLQMGDVNDYDPSLVMTVAADGTGNFTLINDAIGFAPNNSEDRTIIIVREGVYDEYVDVPPYKTNIVILGEGKDVTLIRGNRSVGDGWTTFRSATVAVSGEGFLMRDVTISNTAGPAKSQAVALRVNADLTAVFQCTIIGYQDTLYVHSFRQFYRECNIFGTVDFIFGNAAAVFQGCNIIAQKPMPGQFIAVTAQSRDDPYEVTGISIQNCSVLPTDELGSGGGSTKSYLGRPWREYSRTVYIESYIGDFVDPKGWTQWSGNQGLDTLYYGEYNNYGPGSGTDNRVDWPGYHVMEYEDAFNFTVSEFIAGDEWLQSTSFPYDNGV
ncbi:putative pectinesterase/pectinesterase inhibitor 12 [Acorus gramineus]|uniref:Pectinesterase n=1 Tax=Acorus gramineus TaxID=55184 RepID=A0AAV9BVZ4_ACOGR|nr:putative pectinesterase/pectinesterase inhibitor 12 [Acorus gramineus]